MADIDPSDIPGAIDPGDIDPQSAMAAQGLKQGAQTLGQNMANQWQQGGEQIHQALQGDPGSNLQARAALEGLGSQAAMSTIGGEAPELPEGFSVVRDKSSPVRSQSHAVINAEGEKVGFGSDPESAVSDYWHVYGTPKNPSKLDKITSVNPQGNLSSSAADTIAKIKEKGLSFFDPEEMDQSFIAKDQNGEPIGHLGLDEDYRTQSIKVDPNNQGQGVASTLYQKALNKNGLLRSSHIENQLAGGRGLWDKFAEENPTNVWQARDPNTLQPLDYKVWQKDVDPVARQKEMDIESQVDDLRLGQIPDRDRARLEARRDQLLDMANRRKQDALDKANELGIPASDALQGNTGNEWIDDAVNLSKQHRSDALQTIQTLDQLPKNAEKTKGQINELISQHNALTNKSGHIMFDKGGLVNRPPQFNAMQYYEDGGQVPTPQPTGQEPQVDPSDIPGAITDPTTLSKMPPSQGDQGIDPADQPGAITDPNVQPDETEYTTPGQQAIAAAEGAAQGFAGPIEPYLATKLGITTPEAMLQREQQNPALFETAKVGGSIAGLASGVGELALLGKAGEAAVTAAGLSSKIGASALRGATELGLLSGGDEITRHIEDPATSTQQSLINVGLSAALGGVGGGLLGGAGVLLKEGLPKLAQEIENFKGQMSYRTNVPEPVMAMHEELSARYNELKDMYDETYGASGLKARAIAKSVPPNITDAMLGQASDISQQMTDTIKNMRSKPYSYPDRLVNKLDADVNEYRNKIFPTDGSTPSTQDIFNATQDLKQMTQGYAGYQKFIKPVDEAYDFSKAAHPIATSLKDALEDPDVWGQAADLQQNINGNFVKFKPFIEGFEKSFTDKVPDLATGEITPRVSLQKLQTYLNQAGTFRDSAKKTILQGFLDNGEKYAGGLDDAYNAVGSESPFTPSPMVVSRRSLEETTPGMKVANAFVDKGLGEGTAKGLGAGVGGVAGHAIAGPYGAGLGAYFGEKVFGPMFQKMLPAIAKPLFESVANARGFRAAGRVLESALKGEQLMTNGAKNVFKAGAEVLPVSAVPTLTQIGQLNTRLVAAQNNPQQFTQNATNNQLGTYLPGHAQSMAQTIGNATNYLNALRPDTTKKAPLDSDRVPSSVQKASYNNALAIAQQPMTIMQKVKDGTVTPDDIKHVTSLYPAAWTSMQGALSSAMITHISKGGNTVPYKTRIGLSLALGQGMDSTLTGPAILAAQPQGGGQPQAPMPQAPKQGSKSSTKNLHKIADQAMTPNQARQNQSDK
jgi:hypothetical protein